MQTHRPPDEAASTHGDDAGCGIGELLGDDGALHGSKSGLTLRFEDSRYRHARPKLDLVVELEEWQPRTLGHGPSDRGLSAPHHSVQIDGSLDGHGGSVARIGQSSGTAIG